MDSARECLDKLYLMAKPLIFAGTRDDPEKAHEGMIKLCRQLHRFPILEKMLLKHPVFNIFPDVPISNAAGFNKNGDIPIETLKYLGFDRAVIGTVCFDPWQGNPRPRMQRYSETESLVNWMGLPGVGANQVFQNLANNKSWLRLTINYMATPGKKDDALLSDLQNTILLMRELKTADRFELNISCPNTHSSSGGMDARREYQKNFERMLEVSCPLLHPWQDLWIKVSPDLDEQGVDDIMEIASRYKKVVGFTTTNTTSHHDSKYIPNSPGKGGGSGNALWERSLNVQRMFLNKRGSRFDLIACGGINSTERLQKRIDYGASEAQIYTPLIYQGPKLLRDLRGYLNERSN